MVKKYSGGSSMGKGSKLKECAQHPRSSRAKAASGATRGGKNRPSKQNPFTSTSYSLPKSVKGL